MTKFQIEYTRFGPDLPIGCSLGALDLLGPITDEKGPYFLGLMKNLIISLGAQGKLNPALHPNYLYPIRYSNSQALLILKSPNSQALLILMTLF
jgi:hypothetical protein